MTKINEKYRPNIEETYIDINASQTEKDFYALESGIMTSNMTSSPRLPSATSEFALINRQHRKAISPSSGEEESTQIRNDNLTSPMPNGGHLTSKFTSKSN